MLQNAMAWTLIHFLWQGAILALLFAIANSAARRASARVRYAIASTAMLLMLVSAAVTFLRFTSVPLESPAALSAAHLTLPRSTSAHIPTPEPANYLPWVVYLWMAGVTALSLRLAAQWVRAERYRRHGIRPLDEAWQERFGRIVARLRVSRAVRAYESAIADVPAVVGWLRPVVLVPASALLQLTPAQIEALLAHELAHVRRHDYLINLLQSCVETLFFYHPAVWWVGRRMREERENCCDDLAVSVCGDALVYARALADLELSRSRAPQLAMAANGGSLLTRIERLITPRKMARPAAPIGITVVSLSVAGALLWGVPQQPTPTTNPAPVPTQTTPAPTPQAKPAAPKPAVATATGQGNYIDQMARAGYKDLDVDDLIAMKIHGVTESYIAEIKSLGWTPDPDELVAFKIHGVNAETVKEMRALGYPLDPDQAVAVRIHGITPAYANSWKQLGIKGLDLDNLVALKIHGADPSQLSALKELGFTDLEADDLVGLRVAGVTPDFIREAKARFRNLKLDQIIQLKQMGILDSKDKE